VSDSSADEPPLRAESTAELLNRVRTGDTDALERLFAKCLPSLRRWARGRLPAYARDLLETQDLVQESLVAALRNLDGFEARREGGLQAYLRSALSNRIRDEIRRVKRRGSSVELSEYQPDESASPLERAIGREAIERYETALQKLRPQDREAIVARIELQLSYLEVADALGKSSPDAARVAVTRAVDRLVEEMSLGQ
jgi:RNA polymerase sigma-70 factor, ECF subfamily